MGEAVLGEARSAVSHVEERLHALGFSLPAAPPPIATFVPAVEAGGLLFISGQGPISMGEAAFVGRVGQAVTKSEGYEAARLCVLNCLAVARDTLGSLNRIERVVHLRGFVNSANTFYDQPAIINGASDLLVDLFGENGQHARAALGVSSLPGNIPVEIEMILAVRPAKDQPDG